jgi:hypothetical protein
MGVLRIEEADDDCDHCRAKERFNMKASLIVGSFPATAGLAMSLVLFSGCAAPLRETSSPSPVASRSVTASGTMKLANRFIEAMRKRDGTALERLVHPASRRYYRAKDIGKVSYEEIWLTGYVPAGKLDVVLTDLSGQLVRNERDSSYRLEGAVFHYPVEPSHGLLISVMTATGSILRIAHHAIRAERGNWYIVLPSRTVIEGR